MILWKNVWYNLVGRLPKLFMYYWRREHRDDHYHLAPWSYFMYPHISPWTTQQEAKMFRAIEEAMKKLEFQPPLYNSSKQLHTAWKRQENNPNNQST